MSQIERKQNIILNYIKLVQVISEKKDKYNYEFENHELPFYKGHLKSLLEQEKCYIRTIFHPLRCELWKLVKNNILDPDYYHKYGQVNVVKCLFYFMGH